MRRASTARGWEGAAARRAAGESWEAGEKREARAEAVWQISAEWLAGFLQEEAMVQLQVMDAEADFSPEVTVRVAEPVEVQEAVTEEPEVEEREAQEPEMDQE